MKRFISTLCLLVGASVASYAGVITSPTGNMTGPNSYLQNFDDGTSFPIGSYTSLPAFNATAGTLNTNVTISGSATGGTGSLNTGNRFAVVGGGNSNFGIAGGFLRSYADGPTDASGNFLRTLVFNFSSPVNEFLFNYAAHDGTAFYTVNGLATQYSLVNQAGCSTNCSPASAGFVVDGTVTAINTFSITFQGNDRVDGRGGDVVLIDNLRLVGPTNGTVITSGGNNNVIPEPSTYALMGAGLLALGYARRKK